MKCRHRWVVENVLLGSMVVAAVVCLKCQTLKKPIGWDGAVEFVTQGSTAEVDRSEKKGES